jgi:hypothetical protein
MIAPEGRIVGRAIARRGTRARRVRARGVVVDTTRGDRDGVRRSRRAGRVRARQIARAPRIGIPGKMMPSAGRGRMK